MSWLKQATQETASNLIRTLKRKRESFIEGLRLVPHVAVLLTVLKKVDVKAHRGRWTTQVDVSGNKQVCCVDVRQEQIRRFDAKTMRTVKTLVLFLLQYVNLRGKRHVYIYAGELIKGRETGAQVGVEIR